MSAEHVMEEGEWVPTTSVIHPPRLFDPMDIESAILYSHDRLGMPMELDLRGFRELVEKGGVMLQMAISNMLARRAGPFVEPTEKGFQISEVGLLARPQLSHQKPKKWTGIPLSVAEDRASSMGFALMSPKDYKRLGMRFPMDPEDRTSHLQGMGREAMVGNEGFVFDANRNTVLADGFRGVITIEQ